MIAALHPQPDIPSTVRMLPVQRQPVATTLTAGNRPESASASLLDPVAAPRASSGAAASQLTDSSAATTAASTRARPRNAVAPLSSRRYLIRMTVGEDTQQKLARARDLLRHVIPDGDPAAIFDRALTLLLTHLSGRVRARRSGRELRRAPRPLDNGAHATCPRVCVARSGRATRADARSSARVGAVKRPEVSSFITSSRPRPAARQRSATCSCDVDRTMPTKAHSSSATGGRRFRTTMDSPQLRPDRASPPAGPPTHGSTTLCEPAPSPRQERSGRARGPWEE